jgi:hypothetical protein
LVVGDDFNLAVLENTDARVCGTKINSDSWHVGVLLGCWVCM